jgi:hypothetical protein
MKSKIKQAIGMGLLVGLFPFFGAFAQKMQVSGSFAVSASGAATFTIPLPFGAFQENDKLRPSIVFEWTARYNSHKRF